MFKSFKINTVFIFIGALILFNAVYFFEYLMPLHWLIINAIVIIFSILSFYKINIRWKEIDRKLFGKKLFKLSLIINLISLGFVYLLCYLYNGTFFEPGAADSVSYHTTGGVLAKNFGNGNYSLVQYLDVRDYSDYGYNVFLGTIYFIFGPYTLVARLFNVLFLTLTVNSIFKLTEIIYDLKIAKTASLLTAFTPLLLFFVGVNLKESVMIFLLVAATLFSVSILVANENSTKNFMFLVLSVILLFFFRTVLGVVFVSSFFVFYLVNLQAKNNSVRFFSIIGVFACIIVILFFLDDIGVTKNILRVYDHYDSQTDVELSDKISRSSGVGLSVQKVLVIPLLFISVLIAPFSTMVFLDNQVQIAWLSSGNLMKNIFAFYAIFGLWYSIKHFRKKAAIIICIIIGYSLVIAISAQSTSTRFQLVSLPFLNIFTAVGLHKLQEDKIKYWHIYLFVIFIAIFAWNYFKLSIRNLI